MLVGRFILCVACAYLSPRLLSFRFIGRYATYTGPGFQEGVSLTCVDEVIRLRKYAYGACEMLLNKFKVWQRLLVEGVVLPRVGLGWVGCAVLCWQAGVLARGCTGVLFM